MVALAVVFFLSVGAMILHVSSLQSSLLRASAVYTASIVSGILSDVRTLYTSEVVQPASAVGMDVTHDYMLSGNAIPIPATFSMQLGDLIGKNATGASSRLYSAYPFPWRSVEGGLTDDYSKKAWDQLSRDQGKPYMQFVETRQGLVLRYAVADVMRAACVECHNTHPQSPKRDWQVGNLRGVLEVIIPLQILNQQVSDQLVNIRLIYSLIGFLMFVGFFLTVHRLKLSEEILQLRSNDLEVANQQLKDISESDALTQIANRRCYDARLSAEVLTAKRSDTTLSLLLVDIDCFKLYNDGYGHEQGDEALMQVAGIVNDCMLRETDFLARYGGEEFVALLPFTDVEGAISIAENIRVKIEAAAIPHKFSTHGNCITASVGIATQSGADIDAGILFKTADKALYNAKAKGRNRCEVGKRK